MVIFAGALHSVSLLQAGAAGIGLGGGLFAVGTLTAAMALAEDGTSGLALGAWGAVQATAAGSAIAFGAFLRDLASAAAVDARFGATLASPSTGYGFVYCLEIVLLFGTLVALGPLVRSQVTRRVRFGLSEFPT